MDILGNLHLSSIQIHSASYPIHHRSDPGRPTAPRRDLLGDVPCMLQQSLAHVEDTLLTVVCVVINWCIKKKSKHQAFALNNG